MARKATIVSFDEVKRTSSAARARSSRQAQNPSSSFAAQRPLVYVDPGIDIDFVSPFAQRDEQRRAQARESFHSQKESSSAAFYPSSSAHVSRSHVTLDTPSVPSRMMRNYSSAARASYTAQNASRATRSYSGRVGQSGAVRSSAGIPSWYDGPNERAIAQEQAKRAQIREEAHDIEDEVQNKKTSLKDKLTRGWAKHKADKVFGKQGASAASSTEGGPRAAVYKGEMGSSQRRASRMQNSAGPADTTKRKRAKSSRFAGKKLRIALASAACLALVCVFLYQPAQQYYQALRTHDALAAEYSALQERDDALQSSVDSLSSDAGMEELAHEQLGLVKKGEVAVSVSDLDVQQSTDSSIPPNVSSGSVKAPDTWYSGILDPLFGVE